MSVFLFKRLATFLATLVVASVLVFSVLELLPGNVAQVMLGETATPESVAALERKLAAVAGVDQRQGLAADAGAPGAVYQLQSGVERDRHRMASVACRFRIACPRGGGPGLGHHRSLD